MPNNLDLDAIKRDIDTAELPIDASLIAADAYNMYGLDSDRAKAIARILNSAPALIAEVERLRQRVTELLESNNTYEQQARDARAAHTANGKILEAVQLALVRSEEEAERLEKELATAKRVGAAEWQPIETAPKDGTRILAIFPDGEMRTAIWSNDWNGWNCTGLYWSKLVNWMPLPEPPAELRAEVGK